MEEKAGHEEECGFSQKTIFPAKLEKKVRDTWGN